jgi:hypothetical protein
MEPIDARSPVNGARSRRRWSELTFRSLTWCRRRAGEIKDSQRSAVFSTSSSSSTIARSRRASAAVAVKTDHEDMK